MRRAIAAVVALCVVAAALLTAGEAAVAQDPSAEAIRSTAEDVLSRPAYTGLGTDPISRLIDSNPVTRWIADRIEDFVEWLAGLGSDDSTRPTREVDPDRGSGLLYILIFLGALTAAIAWTLVRRRERQQHAATHLEDLAELPEAELLSRADAAERHGDYESSVRYRFQAGLRRLERIGQIDSDDTTSTNVVRRQVGLDNFDDVATVFETATYSEYEATADDAGTSRAGWDAVFQRLGNDGDDQ